MNRPANSRTLGLVVTTALTAALLSGCASVGFGSAGLAHGAEPTRASRQQERAVEQAEAAVLASPRDAAARVALGAAYLDAGRFASAATTFDDAMKLGDTSTRTVLSLGLALTAQGKTREAADILNQHGNDVPAADLGLALALAGQPERGVQLMSNAIRGGENTAKMRQNLAFAYALAGRWREARLMAEQDVPADKVSDRIEEWALMAQPEAAQQRVASLLSVPANVSDAGQPVALALNAAANPTQQLAAAVETPTRAELPPVAAAGPAAPINRDVPASLQVAAVEPSSAAPVARQAGLQFVAAPVVQAAPARVAPPAPARTATAAKPPLARASQNDAGTHLIQLGSFNSEAMARHAWATYTSRYPDLTGKRMVITEAVVQGKRYWRVSAAGFGRTSAAAACGRIKSSSQGCLAYASDRPLPGAVSTGTRLAQR